ncbi:MULTISPECIES: hypothetical protein [unclassified Chryseobacterium]|uniref:hypothetical protein n=1 Tax=unclassified Chryseobacterium TaxID=2593645 RepID=UPI00226A4BB9|nr:MULTISPECIES: hypothetical protein [unclassified Chryseobacterium]
MIESQDINIPRYFLKKPGVFHIRNVEEYRLFLESYCIGKQLDYHYFKIKFNKFLIENSKEKLMYNEDSEYPDWVAIIRFSSSSNDYLTLEILKDKMEHFIAENKDDKIIAEIFN